MTCIFKSVAVLAFFAISACSPTVYSDADPTVDFSAYKTFSWASSPPLIKSGDNPISALTERNMTIAIRTAMVAKGYKFVNSKDADFAVSFTMGAREEIELQSYPVRYTSQFDTWPWGRSYYGSRYTRPIQPVILETREVEVTKGTLSVDAFDVRTRRPIWHAQASKNLTEAERAGATFAKLFEDATTILADFPARTQ